MHTTRRPLLAALTSLTLALGLAHPAAALQLEHPKGEECRFAVQPGDLERLIAALDPVKEVNAALDALAADYGYERKKLEILAQEPPMVTETIPADDGDGDDNNSEVIISPEFLRAQQEASDAFLAHVDATRPRDAAILAEFLPTSLNDTGAKGGLPTLGRETKASYSERSLREGLKYLATASKRAHGPTTTVTELAQARVATLPERTGKALVAFTRKMESNRHDLFDKQPELRKLWRDNDCNALGDGSAAPVAVDFVIPKQSPTAGTPNDTPKPPKTPAAPGAADPHKDKPADTPTPRQDADSSAASFGVGVLGGVVGAVAVIAALVAAIAQFFPQLAAAVMAAAPKL